MSLTCCGLGGLLVLLVRLGQELPAVQEGRALVGGQALKRRPQRLQAVLRRAPPR
jgi:hypothetical protein